MNIDTVTRGDQRRAINVLTQAFHDDPVLSWISDRPDFLPLFFELTIGSLAPHGLTYVTADESGAASWLPPETRQKWPVRPVNVVRLIRTTGVAGAGRLLQSGYQTEKNHPREPHYYLFAIGTLPGQRGRGMGTHLIRHVLRQCDREGMPAFLENSRPENFDFYQGHGFEVFRQLRFARTAPPVWLMWREPRTPEA